MPLSMYQFCRKSPNTQFLISSFSSNPATTDGSTDRGPVQCRLLTSLINVVTGESMSTLWDSSLVRVNCHSSVGPVTCFPSGRTENLSRALEGAWLAWAPFGDWGVCPEYDVVLERQQEQCVSLFVCLSDCLFLCIDRVKRRFWNASLNYFVLCICYGEQMLEYVDFDVPLCALVCSARCHRLCPLHSRRVSRAMKWLCTTDFVFLWTPDTGVVCSTATARNSNCGWD